MVFFQDPISWDKKNKVLPLEGPKGKSFSMFDTHLGKTAVKNIWRQYHDDYERPHPPTTLISAVVRYLLGFHEKSFWLHFIL